MHVQLFNSKLTTILQHLQKDQLTCIHPLSICRANCNTNEASVSLSYFYSDQCSEVSESELEFSKPD